MTAQIDMRLARLEERLTRLEELVTSLGERIERQRLDTAQAADRISEWVTQFVAMRLQQLVPETCAHPEQAEAGGPYLDGTSVPCTEEVARRVARIPIPFVRLMVARKVADQARRDQVSRVDLAYFERAATF